MHIETCTCARLYSANKINDNEGRTDKKVNHQQNCAKIFRSVRITFLREKRIYFEQQKKMAKFA